MKLPRIFKQRRMRGKSKSPEQRLKEKRAYLRQIGGRTHTTELHTFVRGLKCI